MLLSVNANQNEFYDACLIFSNLCIVDVIA